MELSDQIRNVSWSSGQMGKGKSVCLCRFRSMYGTDELQQRYDSKKWRSSEKSSFQELVINDGAVIELEWNISQGFLSTTIFSRDPKKRWKFLQGLRTILDLGSEEKW